MAPAGVSAPSPSVDLQAVLDHAEGLVCLTGCAGRSAIGEGVRDEPMARRLLEAFGAEDLRVELQRPYARHDRARNRALAAFARRLGVACVATGNVHAHARCRAELQDAFVALRNHTTLDASEPLRRGNNSHVMTSAAGDGQPFRRSSRGGPRDAAARRAADVRSRQDLGYRYPGAEDASAERKLAELCAARLQ